MSVLVIDIGTSGVRAAVVHDDATIAHEQYREALPSSPAPGLVEFDAEELADVSLGVAREVLAAGGPVVAVGVTNQRASTIVWDRKTGTPVGPGIGWQDLRTVGECLGFQAEGLRLAPNLSATKVCHLLDLHDVDRDRDLCFGTVDSWIVWKLTDGAVHVTDLSNAAVTGLINRDGSAWDAKVLSLLRIPEGYLPTIVDSSGMIAEATALDGAPPITGIAGDQQASLIGQGCTEPGPAKITFGTGGMLDVVVGSERPKFDTRGSGGTFPIVAWRRNGEVTWGLEAIMLSAGTNVEWLRDDLGIIATTAESHDIASQCDDTDGVMFVPALLGLGYAVLGLRRAWHVARPHPGGGTTADRASRARRRRPSGRGSGRRGRTRRDPRDRGSANRRRHEPEPHVRAGTGRRQRATSRDLAGRRSHHARCSLLRRPRRRHVGRLGRHRRHLAPHAGRGAPARPRPGPLA